MGGGDVPFSWELSIRHRFTATEDNEDEDTSEGWMMLDDSEDRCRNHTRVAHPLPYRTVTSESITVKSVVFFFEEASSESSHG